MKVKTDHKKSLATLLLSAARNNPSGIAWEKGDEKYSYEALFGDALNISARINATAGKDHHLIPVVADKSYFCYAAIAGIVLAGRGYVPLNPAFPLSRNLEILKLVGGKYFLSGKKSSKYTAGFISAGYERLVTEGGTNNDLFDPAEAGSSGERTLYLLFTSGSTGKPKGVPVSENNLLAYLGNIRELIETGPGDRCSQVFDLTFDLSVHDLFVTWSSGATLIVPEEGSPLFFHKFLKKKKITQWFTVPSTIYLLDKMRLLKGGVYPDLKISLFCGEALPAALAGKWMKAAPVSGMVNLYGPTEATIAVSYYDLRADDRVEEKNGIVSIGRIFRGHEAKILGQKMSGKGELLVHGPQVVKGYYDDREQSASAFTEIDDRLFYKTGDIVERNEDGNMFFLGRKDQEIKLHGYRINLLEVEHCISDSLGGNKAVAVLHSSGPAGKIICFVSGREQKKGFEAEILQYCRQRLPWYMVPEKVIFVKDFPLNPNGKVDRQKLVNLIDEKN